MNACKSSTNSRTNSRTNDHRNISVCSGGQRAIAHGLGGVQQGVEGGGSVVMGAAGLHDLRQ